MLRGREAELAELDRGLALAAQGRPQVYALVGEPGIGKSSLAAEVAARAHERGACVAWGRAWEAGGAAAYWPWRQLVASLPKTPDAARLAELWGRPGSGEFPAADPALAQRQLFEAVVEALRGAAAQGPLLCVLDDLHVADTASLGLLAFVLRGLRLGRCTWLLTWRDAEAERPRVRDLLAQISREAAVLPLRPLSEPDAAGLVAETLGHSDPQTARTLFAATAGNPLFLVEVLRSLTLRGLGAPGQPGLSLAAGAGLPVSQGIALLVRERASHLTPEALAVLEGASVLGRDFERQALSEVSSAHPARLREQLSALVAAGFLRERSHDAWSFSHALVRDALYRELAPDRRQALHLRCAEALDARIDRGAGGLARDRAHHGLQSLPLAQSAQVAGWAIAAAAEARAQCAYEDAVSILEMTCAELPGGDRTEGELLVALGWAHGDAGRGLGMRETLVHAIHLARQLGDGQLLARAVIGYGSRYVLGDVRTDLLPLLDEAEAALGAETGGLHARLLARRAAAMTPAADASVPLAMARAALREVETDADPSTWLEVAVAAGSALGDFAASEERLPVNLRLVAAARQQQDHVNELRGLGRVVTDYLEAGDVARADAGLAEWSALAGSLRHPRFLWMAPLFRSMRAMMSGRFAESHACVAEAVSLAAQAQDENARRCIPVHRHWLLLLQDDAAGLRAHQPQVLAAFGAAMPELAALARLSTLGCEGRFEAVREELTRSVPLTFARLQTPIALATLAEAVAPLGRTQHGRAIRSLLAARASGNAVWGLFGLVCGPPIALALGQLAGAEGELSQAQAHFASALARTQAMGAEAHEAWVRFRHGALLLSSGSEAARAREELERAGELAGRLEMPGLAARARAALEHAAPGDQAAPTPRAGPPPAPAAGLVFSLEREQDGWRLTRGARTGFVRDVRGMGMLAKLLARPGDELHALELASNAAPGEEIDAGDSGELLDDAARAAYKRRARRLSEALAEAEARGDARAAATAGTELEALTKELSRAQGLGGRSRRAGVAAERARVVVQRRVREAIRRLGQLDPELGAFLDAAVRTGTHCSYLPQRAVAGHQG